jgi:hypothetical protein
MLTKCQVRTPAATMLELSLSRQDASLQESPYQSSSDVGSMHGVVCGRGTCSVGQGSIHFIHPPMYLSMRGTWRWVLVRDLQPISPDLEPLTYHTRWLRPSPARTTHLMYLSCPRHATRGANRSTPSRPRLFLSTRSHLLGPCQLFLSETCMGVWVPSPFHPQVGQVPIDGVFISR